MDKLMDDLTELMIFFPFHLNEKKNTIKDQPKSHCCHAVEMIL